MHANNGFHQNPPSNCTSLKHETQKQFFDSEDDCSTTDPLLVSSRQPSELCRYDLRDDVASTTSYSARRRLLVAAVICIFFIISEVIGGYLSNSLAIMSDAAHLVSDCASFLVGVIAITLGNRSVGTRFTFGFRRAEVLGALFTVIFIWYLSGILTYFAVHRIINSEFEVDSDTMIIAAGCAVVFNLLMGTILHGFCGVSHGHAHDDAVRINDHINVRAAFIHVLGDLIQSVGVLVSAVIIKMYPSFKVVDPICSILFSVIVFITTIKIFRDTIVILMECSPMSLPFASVIDSLLELKGVIGVHDLRLWSLSTNDRALSAHVCVLKGNEENALKEATYLLKRKYKIHFSCLQIETSLLPHVCSIKEENMRAVNDASDS